MGKVLKRTLPEKKQSMKNRKRAFFPGFSWKSLLMPAGGSLLPLLAFSSGTTPLHGSNPPGTAPLQGSPSGTAPLQGPTGSGGHAQPDWLNNLQPGAQRQDQFTQATLQTAFQTATKKKPLAYSFCHRSPDDRLHRVDRYRLLHRQGLSGTGCAADSSGSQQQPGHLPGVDRARDPILE